MSYLAKLGENQVLIGLNLYSINLTEGTVLVENVDGRSYAVSILSSLPDEVQTKVTEMKGSPQTEK